MQFRVIVLVELGMYILIVYMFLVEFSEYIMLKFNVYIYYGKKKIMVNSQFEVDCQIIFYKMVDMKF